MAIIEMKAVLAYVSFLSSLDDANDSQILNPFPSNPLSTTVFPSALIANFEFDRSVPDQIAKSAAAIAI